MATTCTVRCYFVEFLQRLQVAQVSILLDGTKCITFLCNSIFSNGKQDTAFAWDGLGIRPSTYSCLKVTDGGELHVRFKLAEGQGLASHPLDLQLKKPENTVLALRCRFCRSLLTDSNYKFKRVLPLPSDSWQEFYADVFCHMDHSHDCTTQPFHSVRPKEGDCLVGDDKLVVTFSSLRQESVVVDTTKARKEGTIGILCTRCYSILGTVLQGECDTLEAVDTTIEHVRSLPFCLKLSKLLVEEGGIANTMTTPSKWGHWKTLEDYFARRLNALAVATESFRFVLQSDLGSMHIWVLSSGNRVTWSVCPLPGGHDDGVDDHDAFSGCYDGPEMELHCFGASCRPVLKLLYKAVHTAVDDVEVLKWDEEDWLNLKWILSCRTRALPPSHRVANGFDVGFLGFLL